MLITLRLLGMCLLAPALAYLNPAAAAPGGRNLVVGYYVVSAEQINRLGDDGVVDAASPLPHLKPEDARALTHIVVAFLDIDKQGRCAWEQKVEPRRAGALVAGLARLRQYNPELRILYSVGGWVHSNDAGVSHANYVNAVSTPEARQRLAKSCVKLMADYGFDGIDVDWEYPQGDDVDHYVEALQALRAQLDAQTRLDSRQASPYQLTMASAGSAYWLARYYHRLGALAAPLDYLSLMTHDLSSPGDAQTNHQAPLFGDDDATAPRAYNRLRDAPLDWEWSALVKAFPSPYAVTVDAAVRQYLLSGEVPAEKIVLGVAFQGRVFREAGDPPNGQYAYYATTGDAPALIGCDDCIQDQDRLSYRQIQRMLSGGHGYQRAWNDKTKTPFLHHPERRLFVTYDDADSLKYKTAYIRQQHLGGVMIWQLGQDDDQGTLLAALHRYLADPACDAARLDLGNGERYLGTGRNELPATSECAALPVSR